MKYNLIHSSFIQEQDKKLQTLLAQAKERDDAAMCTVIAGQLSMLVKVQEAMGNSPKLRKVMEEAFDAGREHEQVVDFGEPTVEFTVDKKEFFKYF